MTIKIFVNWRLEEVLTEDEYNEQVREMAEDLRTDNDYGFSEFLAENYSHRALWEADEEERAKIMEHWVDKCFEVAEYELGYDEVVLEV